MDAVSFDTRAEYDAIADIIEDGNVPYIWTGGRKCNFAGCDRPDLQPAVENGWFWAPRGRKIAPPSNCQVCDWSFTGGLGRPQPDNRMFGETGGRVDEGCIAVLNDHYDDGTKWHDVACENEKPVVCQEEPALLALVDVP